MGQGITKIFGVANIFALAINLVFGYIFVIRLNYGVLGFGYCKIIMELINSGFIIYIVMYQIHRET